MIFHFAFLYKNSNPHISLCHSFMYTSNEHPQSVWTHPSLQTTAVPIVTSKQRKRMNVLLCHIYSVNDVGEDNNETVNGVIGHLSFWCFYDSLLQHHDY